MVIDLHAITKNQLSIFKHLEQSAENCSIVEIY